MRRPTVVYALILSLLLNVGVLGAVAYRALDRGGVMAADLADRLKLDPAQRQRWHALEEGFVQELDAGWREIAGHRERLIREVFADQPNRARIESERARIADLQARQQQRVIAQFLQERDILDAEQRRALVELLLREEPGVPLERQLHGG